jgi:hypothetical protein
LLVGKKKEKFNMNHSKIQPRLANEIVKIKEGKLMARKEETRLLSI